MLKKRSKRIVPPYGEHEYQQGRGLSNDRDKHHHGRKRFVKSPKLKKYLELHMAKDSTNKLGSLYSAYTMLTKKEPYIITAADSRIGDRPNQQDS